MELWVLFATSLGAILAALVASYSAFISRRELNTRLRPWIGVFEWTSSGTRFTSSEGLHLDAGITITNYGALPALAEIACSLYDQDENKHEVVIRSGWLLWPGQKGPLSWNILPPISAQVQITTEIVITYHLPSSNKTFETREVREFHTGSLHFVDASYDSSAT